jgi:hypothetical protein
VQLGDFDLWIRLAALGEFFILPEHLTKIRIIEGTNLSRPSLPKQRRSQVEHATVLERYTDSPILEQVARVFPDLSNMHTSGAKKVALALRAWHHGGAPHALFADRTIASVMENVRDRADALLFMVRARERNKPSLRTCFIAPRFSMQLKVHLYRIFPIW